MTRDNKVSVYVNDQEKSRIKREANERGMSISAYILASLEDRWTTDDTEATAERAKVEERVERITTEAVDSMETLLEQQQKRTDQMADMVARSAVYSIANFESLKYQHKLPEEVKTKSLKLGARRLGDPLDLDADQDAAIASSDLSDDLTPTVDDPESESESEENSGGIKEGFFDRYA